MHKFVWYYRQNGEYGRKIFYATSHPIEAQSHGVAGVVTEYGYTHFAQGVPEPTYEWLLEHNLLGNPVQPER